MPTRAKSASHPGAFAFQYAAKFICTSNIPNTSQTTPSLLPGNYQTVVNVHNPNEKPVRMRVKVALGARRLISKWVPFALGPDEVTRFVCADVREKFGIRAIHGVEGFLVVESSLSLDVVAVYTASPLTGEGVSSIDVERVHERAIAHG
jgi:hypothetical protein